MSKKTVVALAIRGPIRRGGLASVCASADSLLQGADARTLVCDISDMGGDAVAVEALVRLRLVAQRRRVGLRLVGMSPELRELIVLCGLDELLRGCAEP